MASKKKTKAEKSRVKDPNSSTIEVLSDEPEYVVPSYSCLPWKSRRQQQELIERLIATIEKLKVERNELEGENKELKKDKVLLEQKTVQLQSSIERLKKDKKELKQTHSQLQSSIERLEKDKQELEQKTAQLQSSIESLEKGKQELEQKTTQLQSKIKELEKHRDALEQNMGKLQKTLDVLNRDTVPGLRKEKDGLLKEKDKLKQKTDELLREKAGLENEKDRWEGLASQMTEEKGRLQREKDHCLGEIGRLREDITAKTAQIADYKHRLSEMASERMRHGNACVEDLNDPFRPTALADKWTGLFKTGEYWTAYDKAQNTLKTDEATAQFLYNVTKTAWNVCFDFVEDFVPRVLVAGPFSSKLHSTESEKELRQQMLEKLPEVRRKLEELLPQDASRVDKFVKTLEEEYNNVRQTDIPNLQQKLRKAVSLLPKTASPPALLAKKVAAAVHEEENSKYATVDENFIRKLTGLCYLMRLQEVPLSVNFDFTRGSPLDQSMFEVESNASQPLTDMAIKSILRPPLLRSAGGAVLSKGEADVEPAKPASDNTTQDKVQSSGKALGKKNGDETAEPKGNELDERKKEDESNQNEEGGDIAAGVKVTSTDSSPQDGTSDQDKAQENSANASQTNPDEHEEKSDQDKHKEGSGRDQSEEGKNANQNNARGIHDNENDDSDVSLD